MHTLHRAITSVGRNIIKTIILFLITLILGVLLMIVLLAHYTSSQAQQNVINNMNPQAIIGKNWMKLRELQLNDDAYFRRRPIIPPLSVELIQEIATLPYVERYEYYIERNMFSGLTSYRPPTHGLIVAAPLVLDLGEIYTVRGVRIPQFAELEHSVIALVAGRTFTNEELELSKPVAIISEELARINQLMIGSIITLESMLFYPDQLLDSYSLQARNMMDAIPYEVKIIGTYRMAVDLMTSSVYEGSSWWMLKNHLNRIYVPNGFVQQVDDDTWSLAKHNGFVERLYALQEINFAELSWDEGFIAYGGLYMSMTHHVKNVDSFFILADSQYMIPFVEAVEPKLPEFYIVEFAENHFQAIIHAFESLEETSAVLLLLIIGAVMLIMSLVITLFLRSRKQEIGIYLALGSKRVQIADQMIREILLITTPALLLSLFIGGILGGYISNRMLMVDLIRIEETSGLEMGSGLFYHFGLGGNNAGLNMLLSNYNTSLTLELTVLFLASALITILVSITIPLMHTLQQKPKRIMFD